jgi:hypothetical protein
MENAFDPNQLASTDSSDQTNQSAEKTDLIKFYNRIFISRVEDFVKLLHPSGPDSKEVSNIINQMGFFN